MEYKIKKGDNLSSLAKRFGMSVEAIAKANNISDPDRIYAGATLTIPDKTKPKPQKELRQGLLNPDMEMFDPQSQALQGSYPELLAMGIPGLLRSAGAATGKGLLAGTSYRNLPAWLNNPATQGVMKQNPTRTFNELSKAAVANEPKFTIGANGMPEAMMLERLLMARRFQ
jgi:LysM repeat protein